MLRETFREVRLGLEILQTCPVDSWRNALDGERYPLRLGPGSANDLLKSG